MQLGMKTYTWHEIVPLLVFLGFYFAFALMGVAIHIILFWIKLETYSMNIIL
jgi:hypothetical protein